MLTRQRPTSWLEELCKGSKMNKRLPADLLGKPFILGLEWLPAAQL